eukprot:TRINITY_DN4445_c0_g1_i3.p1 TRINITY_DN4445_c0_g1~~TRINITY_DN4445_c0_g1_i3.p1  ORF type:complete len:188 (-),score=48.21 TRINITY_DN4445_c0_g1_i3:132-695(-)
MEQTVSRCAAEWISQKEARDKQRKSRPPRPAPRKAGTDNKQANLTHQQTKAALVLFTTIDLDGSAMISFSELKEASVDDTAWRNMDADMNGDIGLHEWMTFLRRTKMDRGSKGLNHWLVDMGQAIGDDGAVKNALYRNDKVEREEEVIPLGEGLRMSEMGRTDTNNNVLTAGPVSYTHLTLPTKRIV